MDNGNVLAVVLAVVLIAEIISVTVSKKGFTVNAIKLIGLTLVSFLGVFALLTSSTESEKALPAVFGLLGSGLGFLLGKTEKTED